MEKYIKICVARVRYSDVLKSDILWADPIKRRQRGTPATENIEVPLPDIGYKSPEFLLKLAT